MKLLNCLNIRNPKKSSSFFFLNKETAYWFAIFGSLNILEFSGGDLRWGICFFLLFSWFLRFWIVFRIIISRPFFCVQFEIYKLLELNLSWLKYETVKQLWGEISIYKLQTKIECFCDCFFGWHSLELKIIFMLWKCYLSFVYLGIQVSC